MFVYIYIIIYIYIRAILLQYTSVMRERHPPQTLEIKLHNALPINSSCFIELSTWGSIAAPKRLMHESDDSCVGMYNFE